MEHSHSCGIELAMDADECENSCERLREIVGLGPGPYNAIFALPEAGGITAELRQIAVGEEIIRRLAKIDKEFVRWFSEADWRGRDRGMSLQRDLYANIWCLKLSIRGHRAAEIPRGRYPNAPASR